MPLPTLSVIIPTYNRSDYLRQMLAALALQRYGANRPAGSGFEVIIVDDGSEDDTPRVVNSPAAEYYPFKLRYVRQENAGDAAARNTGVQHSTAELLVFLDDDVLPGAGYLARLAEAHRELGGEKHIVVGTEILWLKEEQLPTALPAVSGTDDLQPIPFADVCSNNMSIYRQAYIDLGMMDNLDFRGSSIWCDVDFAYRAHQQGFQCLRSTAARCWHRDYTMRNLESRQRRAHEVAYRAVALLARHPDLLPHLPMLADKTPVDWRHDSPGLILRKLVRRPASLRPVLWGLEQGAQRLPSLREPLERWVVGGYLYRGFRKGLREWRQNEYAQRRPVAPV